MSGFVSVDGREETDREADDLRALVQSAGWLRFARWAASEWGDSRIVERMRAATGSDAAQMEQVARVLASVDAVQQLMTWPQTRLSNLTRKADEARPSSKRA